jgi:uncharacterized protein (TIGR03118 family)
MSKSAPFKSILATVTVIGASFVGAPRSEAYTQINLVSDIPGLAPVTDMDLVNPWGVSFIPPSLLPPDGTPFWVSDQGSATSTLYAATSPTSVSKAALTVSIPPLALGQGPTGQVSNTNTKSFILSDKSSALFIFANLNGKIYAWNGGLGTTASVEATGPAGASYTGLAINRGDTMLYAANDSAGTIDVFNKSFTQVHLGANAFKDPAITGLVPFNVEDINGDVYVTYAPAGHLAQTKATPGQGAVAVFGENGKLIKTLINGPTDPLAAPWGLTFAPASFGKFGGDLLVGNFSYSNSWIDAFNPTTGAFLGTIPINVGVGDTPGGLWTLTFGGGGRDGSPKVLYFTDGINKESAGLFGAITVPEPATWAMMALGFAGLGYAGLRRSRTRRAPFAA